MKVLKSQTNNRIAKIWTDDLSNIESQSLDQIRLMLEFPYLFKHIAVMPDTHLGKGAVVGGVVATEKTVVPNIVGVDIGCGMSAFDTGIKLNDDMKKTFWEEWRRIVRETIPVGFKWFNSPQDVPSHLSLDRVKGDIRGNLDKVPKQLGTLGGGNHFLEAQFDADTGHIWFMVHSGSRNIGLQISNYYNKKAKEFNERYKSRTPDDLWFLHIEDELFHDYMNDMKWATDYALESRWRMLEQLTNAFLEAGDRHDMPLQVKNVRKNGINIHHNFATMENHFGENVVVHRKGATQAKEGQIGIIPGSMGSNSYIVKGKGVDDSYKSCSHGAGRTMSRTAAKKSISIEQFEESLESTFNTPDHRNIDEAPGAYKDIDSVMGNQTDLVDITNTLKPIITVKG